ncbi:MAG: inositol monophosphatase [Verrucomicrobiota bacterium]
MPGKISRQAQAKLDAELRHRINAGRVAVKNQMAFFTRQFGEVASEWKADDTRVTFADFAISENVFAELRRDFPTDDYCSEEANPLDEVQSLSADFAWVIDPIDGTNNYALGFPVCAISLALLHEGEPFYGFIYDHGTRHIYEGGPDYGVFCDQKKLDRDRYAADAQTMIGLHFPMTAAQLAPLSGLMEKYRVRCLGSGALTALYVATGYLTGVVDHKVKVWDIAAAHAICLGAGVGFHFLNEESAPFPLKEFHPQLNFCPYAAGTDGFLDELSVPS